MPTRKTRTVEIQTLGAKREGERLRVPADDDQRANPLDQIRDGIQRRERAEPLDLDQVSRHGHGREEEEDEEFSNSDEDDIGDPLELDEDPEGGGGTEEEI